MSELPGGLTNTNLRVTTDDEPTAGRSRLDLVVRWSHGDAALLGIDRDAEHANTAAAFEAGVGAEVVEYRPDLSMLVITFLPGEALVDADFGDPDVMARAADAVRRLHGGPSFSGDFDMFARRASYLQTVHDRGLTLPASYEQHEADWDDVRRALAAVPRRAVPCNNDLLAANFLDDGAEVRLIDYEYSGTNDAFFELGNTATECGFDDDQVDAWVTAYLGSPTRADLSRTRVQMLCSAYGWSLWGYIQAAFSPLDFDFTAWGDERYEKAAAVFGGPDLRRWLGDLVP